jgi:hypothetical protein
MSAGHGEGHRCARHTSAMRKHAATRQGGGFPGTESLQALVNDLLGSSTVVVTNRQRNPRSSSAASEIVQASDGHSTLKLFLKYGTEDRDTWSAHRRGVPYESAIYEAIADPWCAPAPRFIGHRTDPLRSVLAIEFLDGVKRAHDPQRVVTAAIALGKWHSRCERMLVR